MDFRAILQQTDPAVYAALIGEEKRQTEGMELIASENYVSPAVLEVLGSVFTNKYAEGYPGKRYYGGQEFTDAVELLAIDRAKKLFPGANFVNVQSHSGCPANEAVYSALLDLGDTVLGMDLSHGGHLSHGHPVTKMSKLYNFVRYKMKNIETGEIDYEALRQTALETKPKLILAGFSAYPRELDYAKFKAIADEVGAITMMDMAHIAGLIAGKQLKNPFDFGFDIVTTTTHKTLRGPRGGMILSAKEEHAKAIDKMIFPGLQGGPHMHAVAGKAVAFGEALKPEFEVYAKNIIANAKAMADEFMKNGARLITGGTDNHMMLIDTVTSWGATGSETETVLDKVHITLNKNAIADDPRGPMDPSGIRLGTPAMTTRGFGEAEFRMVAQFMMEAVKNRDNDAKLAEIAKAVKDLNMRFPVPGIA
ncbi:MAG: serine hydroxymethyltransferase [Candidatus Peregrinibacteria bacterium]